MTNRILFSFIVLLMFSCGSKNDYWINCENVGYGVDHRSILFIAESGHCFSMQHEGDTSGLKSYLSPEEFKTAFDTFHYVGNFDATVKVLYKTEFCIPYTLFQADNFVAEIVHMNDNTDNRGYYFQIRTYDKEHRLIMAQDFATWADRPKRYCSGYFSADDTTFTVTCKNTSSEYRFDPAGRMIEME